MRPFTETTPKPLLKICGKTLIEHNIEPIIAHFDEVFMIVKYKKEQFHAYFGEEYMGKKVNYIEQGEAMGTGAAILALKWHIQGDFLVISGDDLYDGEDIIKLSKTPWYATLCKAVDNPENFGIFVTDTNGRPTGIIEKPTDATLGNLANIGNHKFDEAIFDDLEKLPLSPRGELEITDLIHHYMHLEKYSVVEAYGRWITIGYPWDLLKAQDEIIGKYTQTIDKWAIIEPNVFIKWNIYLEEGVILKSGTYIEGNVYFGKESVIGPNAYIRGNTGIWNKSKIGASVEVKNSYIGEASHIPHLSCFGDSLIWNWVNIGGGSTVANLRHDGVNIRAMAKDTLVDTGRRKLGAIIGDNAHLGIGTIIYPGRTIPTNGTTLPWEIVK
jgi:UDP-N-acetylglucosamine diphosphorylase / glucose-1-phosphate thymidylyltransferase / UDP-N-acetylgalactosamine diphosphorylase / glucosamine-1-phosphate N-acetyltransferase / galactosamine-1-phosphate N-acetyltransferase